MHLASLELTGGAVVAQGLGQLTGTVLEGPTKAVVAMALLCFPTYVASRAAVRLGTVCRAQRELLCLEGP